MEQIGLYYPYFHVRDDTWLKAAALYLPAVARVRPYGYPVRDSATATALRAELNFLHDVAPGRQAATLADEFAQLLSSDLDDSWDRYRVRRQGEGFGSEVGNPWYQDESRFAWIHRSQLGDDLSSRAYGPLIDQLRETGLAITTRFDPLTGTRDDINWVGMHPNLVATYSCVLAYRIARDNALVPVTHDPRLFALPAASTLDDMAAVLLHNRGVPSVAAAEGGAATRYASVAVRAVIPGNLTEVPVEAIIRARRTLSDEFDAFRAHVDALGDEWSRLDATQDLGLLTARIESMAQRNLLEPVRDLERGLRALRLEPVRAVFGMKSLELPVLAALAANAANLSPVVAAGGAVALQLVSAIRAARAAATDRRSGAAGYLLGLRAELSPADALARARRAILGG